MRIRELTDEADRRKAVPILRQLRTDADPDEVLARTGEDDYHPFGGFVDGDLVSVAGVPVATHLHHVRHAWLYDLVVDDPHRGEGCGSALVARVEGWAADRDCESVALASPTDRTDVHEFYGDRGYETWGYVVEKDL